MGRPAEICQPPSRTVPKQIDSYDYPAHYLVRRTSRAGTINVFHKHILVSKPLHEDYFGLEEIDDGVKVYDLFFCFYHLSHYELHTDKIHDTLSKVTETRVWADHPSKAYIMS